MPSEACPSSVNIGHQFVVRGFYATIRITQAPDVAGRRATRSPDYRMARQYLGVLWEGLMVGLLQGLPRRPSPPRTSDEQPRRRRRLCSSIPMLQWAIDLDRCFKQPPSRVM